MCDSCEALMINGVHCHETGCPVAWKDHTSLCDWCGYGFKPEFEGQRYCSSDCQEGDLG